MIILYHVRSNHYYIFIPYENKLCNTCFDQPLQYCSSMIILYHMISNHYNICLPYENKPYNTCIDQPFQYCSSMIILYHMRSNHSIMIYRSCSLPYEFTLLQDSFTVGAVYYKRSNHYNIGLLRL